MIAYRRTTSAMQRCQHCQRIGKTMYYFNHNGHMYTACTKESARELFERVSKN